MGKQVSSTLSLKKNTFESLQLVFTKLGLLEFSNVNANVQQRCGLLGEEFQLGLRSQVHSFFNSYIAMIFAHAWIVWVEKCCSIYGK